MASSIGFVPSCKSKTLGNNLATEERKKNKSPLGIALVGLGDYSYNQLGPALRRTNHCKLTGIVTGSPEKIPLWKEEFGIKEANVYNYENMDKIADNDEIDAVSYTHLTLPTTPYV